MSLRNCLTGLLLLAVAALAGAATPADVGGKDAAASVWLLTADRVFDARSEQAHAGWATSACSRTAPITRSSSGW